jgi:hypothetical protein
MRICEHVACRDFPCGDVKHEGYIVPDVDLDPLSFSIIMISEATPSDPADYYYAEGNPQFQQTTVQAFRDAGADIATIPDLLDLGVYFTTAVKCSKTAYGIKAATIRECSHLLEEELSLFADARVYMLMGDVAIKAVNYIAKRSGEPRVIPAGSTYRIRGQAYHFRGKRAFPSYLQAGPSFGIEKSKRRMIAEDIAAALAVVGQQT